MDGSTILGSQEVNLFGTPIRPDASWKIAGLGDFDGDAATDFLWRGPSGELVDWSIANATSLLTNLTVKPAPGTIKTSAELTLNGTPLRPDASWTIAGVGDFDANGTADILWRGASGNLSIWSMNGSVISSAADPTFQGTFVRPDASWHIVQVGDFNGDSFSDILWRSDGGALAEWLMNGSTIVSSATLTSSGVPVSPDSTWTTQAKPTNFA